MGRSRPVSRILCAARAAGDHLSRRAGRTHARRRPVHRAGAAYPAASDGPPCCLLDLAPSGACRAAPVTRRAGGLLPHRFTLTAPANRCGGLLSVALPRGHPRPALAGTLPCGVRTFLERSEDHPRPPGRLLHTRAYPCGVHRDRCWGRRAQRPRAASHVSTPSLARRSGSVLNSRRTCS